MSKSKKELLYFFWSAAILICIVLVFFALIFASCSGRGTDGGESAASPPVTGGAPTEDEPGTEQTPNSITSPPVEETDPAVTDPAVTEPASPSTVLAETADMGQEYVDRLVFLGDSTTYGLRAYSMLSGGRDTAQVWTPASGTLTLSNQGIATIVYPETGEELSITAAVAAKKPEYLVITLGVNGVSFMDEEYFTSEYTKLVNSVAETSPDTRIILNSIYPVCASYKYLSSISNDKITAANGWIQNVAESQGLRYLDSASAIVGQDGFLPEGYSNGDGIHLNETGFGLILDYIRTHGYQ